jgi:glycosyltransferase involved in cell wall biosynthesis
LNDLRFKVDVPLGLAYQTGPEQQYCVNPFFLFKLLWNRPQVVICGGYSIATLMVWLASWISNIKYVIWTEATMHTDGRIGGLRLKVRRLMAGRAAAFVEAGTLAREYVKYLCPAVPEGRLFRAFNCVDNEHFTKAPVNGMEFAVTRGFPKQYLLFVGKMNERKGVPRLLELYKELASLNSQAGMVLIGDGPLLGEVEQFKSHHHLSRLFVEGWVPNEETAKYYATAGAFVLLSAVDHNPLVLFEALAAGVPVVCSNGVCNALDFIQDGVNGYIVDPANQEESLRRVNEVLGWNEERRRACAHFSRETVKRANYADAANAFISAASVAIGNGLPGLPADAVRSPLANKGFHQA